MTAIRSVTTGFAAAILLGATNPPPVGRSARHRAPGDACALLTQAEVSAALGIQVTAGQRLIPSDPRICGWSPPGGPSIDGKKLLVTLMTERQFNLGKTPMTGIAKTPVSGIGDDAYYVTAGGLGTALSVKKGSFYVQIKVGGFPTDVLKDKEKTLALEALAKA
jgi:hypothetical protein